MRPETEEWPAVSVVIPARDAAGVVAEAVRSILAQDYPGSVEVVVAVPPDDTATLRAIEGVECPTLRVVPNPTGVTSAGLNAAIAASRGEVVARCDAQSRLPPGYLRRAVHVLRETGAGNVGGLQRPVGTSRLQRAIAYAMASPLGAGDARYRIGGPPGPTDTVYLGVYRREAIEQAGGFDETLVRNQDYELNWRLRQAGLVVWFDPHLSVDYLPRQSLRGLWRQYFDYGRWKREVLRRHPGSLRWRQLAPPLLVAGVAGSLLLAALAGDWRWLLAPAAYAGALAAAGAVQAVRERSPLPLLLPVVLPVMHLAWGIGFLLPAGRRRPA